MRHLTHFTPKTRVNNLKVSFLILTHMSLTLGYTSSNIAKQTYLSSTKCQSRYSVPVRTVKPRVQGMGGHIEKHTWSGVCQCVHAQRSIHAAHRAKQHARGFSLEGETVLRRLDRIVSCPYFFAQSLDKQFTPYPLAAKNPRKIMFCAEDSLNRFNFYHKASSSRFTSEHVFVPWFPVLTVPAV